jgi:hypothetical protein
MDMSALTMGRRRGTARRIGEIALGLALLGGAGLVLRSHLATRCDGELRSARSGITFHTRHPAGAYRSGLTSGFYAPVLDRGGSRTG